MKLIDADELGKVKFHQLPYTHITPSGVEAESYKRGWNDAIDSIIEDAPTIEPERKKGKWMEIKNRKGAVIALRCDKCLMSPKNGVRSDFCPNCGADMRQREDDNV